jgi:multiple sugar transport system permease protein
MYKHLIIHIVLVIFAVGMVVPFIIMVSSSFKTNGEIMRMPITIIPKKWTFTNYQEMLTRNILTPYKNTTIVAIFVVVSQLLTGSMAAYAFARLEFPLKNVMFLFILALCMVPAYMMLIPRYRMISSWQMTNTLLGIILPNSVSITVVFFLRQSFLGFPKELEEAAKIDGAGHVRIFFTMVLRLHKTALSAMGVMVLLFAWNDLLWPNIVISSEKKHVLSIFVKASSGMHGNEYGYLMAAGCAAIFPMIIVYAFGQKSFMASISITGIRG